MGKGCQWMEQKYLFFLIIELYFSYPTIEKPFILFPATLLEFSELFEVLALG